MYAMLQAMVGTTDGVSSTFLLSNIDLSPFSHYLFPIVSLELSIIDGVILYIPFYLSNISLYFLLSILQELSLVILFSPRCAFR